jgi:hypothetical protein
MSTNPLRRRIYDQSDYDHNNTDEPSPSPAIFGQNVTYPLKCFPPKHPATLLFGFRNAHRRGQDRSDGVAQLTMPSLLAGTHSLKAVYAGAGLYSPSQSAVTRFK